ncbi:MAG: hypothetical protein ACOC2W_02305 [bacterium]
MIITVNDFLDIPIKRDSIKPEHVFNDDVVQCMAGNTKVLQSNIIKKHKWKLVTSGLTPSQAFSVSSILQNLGDYWSFKDDWYSGKGQKAQFETDVSNPSEPVLISGVYNNAVRLNDYDMILKVYLEREYMITFYRQLVEFDSNFYHYIIDGEGTIWINGELANEQTIEEHGINDWLEINVIDNNIIFKKEAGDIDDVYVMVGIIHDDGILNPENIYNAGELPINPPYLRISGKFLDQDYMNVICTVNKKSYESIGNSISIPFTVEEVM